MNCTNLCRSFHFAVDKVETLTRVDDYDVSSKPGAFRQHPEGVTCQDAAQMSAAPKEIALIRGAIAGTRLDLAECLQFAGDGKVKVHYSLEPLEAINGIFGRMRKNKIDGRVVM